MKPPKLYRFLYEKYHGTILAGVVLSAVAVWLYEYFYSLSGDDLIGLLSAACLFLGILVLGYGIRGWRDGDEWRHRYVKMRSKQGAEVMIKKRKKKKW
jgi:hypothetical protein